MQLYIDANIYLEYFRKSSAERLTPLEELVKLIEAGKVELLLPQQTKEEYYRNRKKIAEETRRALIEHSRHSSLTPAIFDKSMREVAAVKKYNKSLSEAYKKLIKKYDMDVDQEKTHADILLKKLFNLATPVLETDEIISRAYKRYMKGNPPRKNDHSYGDAITWESLMEVTGLDSLAIVTKDSDYIETAQSKEVLNSFLTIEWKANAKKGKKINLFSSLAEFVNTVSPQRDKIKEEVVQQEKLDTQPQGIFNVATEIFKNGNGGGGGTSSIVGGLVKRVNGGRAVWGKSLVGGFGGVNQIIYCPYCGSEVLDGITVFRNTNTCTNCGNSFQFSSVFRF